MICYKDGTYWNYSSKVAAQRAARAAACWQRRFAVRVYSAVSDPANIYSHLSGAVATKCGPNGTRASRACRQRRFAVRVYSAISDPANIYSHLKGNVATKCGSNGAARAAASGWRRLAIAHSPQAATRFSLLLYPKNSCNHSPQIAALSKPRRPKPRQWGPAARVHSADFALYPYIIYNIYEPKKRCNK